MEVTLSINDKCELVATPGDDFQLEEALDEILEPTECREASSDVYIEFLLSSNIKDIGTTLKVSYNRDYYVQPLKQDGLYVYYIIKTTDETDLDETYTGLYFNSKDSNIYYNKEIVKDLTQLIEIIPFLKTDEGVSDWTKDEIFSICYLKKCLLELQKKSIASCKYNSCRKEDSAKQDRDFLFISIYLLENLICNERYGEAMDIVKSLEGCNLNCNPSAKTRCNCG